MAKRELCSVFKAGARTTPFNLLFKMGKVHHLHIFQLHHHFQTRHDSDEINRMLISSSDASWKLNGPKSLVLRVNTSLLRPFFRVGGWTDGCMRYVSHD